MRETDELVKRAIRMKLEKQRDCVLVFDAVSSFDAPPPAEWRAEIEADSARLRAWAAEMPGVQ